MKTFVSTIRFAALAVIALSSANAFAQQPCPPDRQCVEEIVVTDQVVAGGAGSMIGIATVVTVSPGGVASLIEQQRQARCSKNAGDQAIYKCNTKTGFPPGSADKVSVPSIFLTQNLWKQQLLDFMNAIYASDNQYVLQQDWNKALASALQKCGGDAGCNAEVWFYFGQTNVALPNFPVLGDINWFVNAIASRISPPNFDSSPAKSLFEPLVNGQKCTALVQAAQADGC